MQWCSPLLEIALGQTLLHTHGIALVLHRPEDLLPRRRLQNHHNRCAQYTPSVAWKYRCMNLPRILDILDGTTDQGEGTGATMKIVTLRITYRLDLAKPLRRCEIRLRIEESIINLLENTIVACIINTVSNKNPIEFPCYS